MLTSQPTNFSISEVVMFRRFVMATGFAIGLFATQTLPVHAQDQRPAQQQQAAPEEEGEVEEVELTPKHIDAFIATQKEITPITAKLQGDAQPSQQMMAQMESIAKKNGFKDFDEFGDVGGTIGMVFGGIDPQSKRYDPQELIKREIATVNADTKIPPAEKKKILQDLEQAGALTPKLKYPGNADLVAKNYDRLKPILEQQ